MGTCKAVPLRLTNEGRRLSYLSSPVSMFELCCLYVLLLMHLSAGVNIAEHSCLFTVMFSLSFLCSHNI